MNEKIERILDDINDIECYYIDTDGCYYQDLEKEELLLIRKCIIDLQKENEDYHTKWCKLMKDYGKLQKKNEESIKIYDETITYLTTINAEYMDSNTKETIKDMIKTLEKQLNILRGTNNE